MLLIPTSYHHQANLKPYLKMLLIGMVTLINTGCMEWLQPGPSEVPPPNRQVLKRSEYFGSEAPPEAIPPQQPDLRAAMNVPLPATTHGIEVIWESAGAAVEGYIIRYGNKPSELTSEVKLPTERLEKFADHDGTTLYRFIVPDQTPDQQVFVTVTSYIGDHESELGEAREAQKAQNEVR